MYTVTKTPPSRYYNIGSSYLTGAITVKNTEQSGLLDAWISPKTMGSLREPFSPSAST